jgi:membrane fusion protein, multidrug efflux system
MTKKQKYYFGLIILLLAVGFYIYEKYTSYFPSTDNAYVQANIVNIAAQVSGPVKEIYVSDHALVHKGQLLFTIDPHPFEIALSQASANLAEAEATLDTQQKNTARILKLAAEGQMTKAEGDDAQGKLDALTNAAKAAQSRLESARLDLSYTQVFAPAGGYLDKFSLRIGQVIQADNFLFALVENRQWWVDANFKETDLERIRPGQPVKVVLDMYPELTFKGKVTAISAGSGATFSIFPPENATGNWVKVTQRFPVRIEITPQGENHPLRVGASCTVTVDTRDRQ